MAIPYPEQPSVSTPDGATGDDGVHSLDRDGLPILMETQERVVRPVEPVVRGGKLVRNKIQSLTAQLPPDL